MKELTCITCGEIFEIGWNDEYTKKECDECLSSKDVV